MAANLMITVELPGGMKVSWEPLNKRSAIRQAKIEAERGALVKVEEMGIVVWTNHDGPMK